MKISFHGACREVTGSCILVETEKTKFLVDCGMFQDEETYFKNETFSFNPSEIDFVLLTHAHIDHCGRLPKLYREGFRGKIYCTEATRQISTVMMMDSAKVFLKEKEHSPLYFESDVSEIANQFFVIDYNKETKVSSDVKIKLRDAGHVIGSAVFEVFAENKKIVFSGDLGNSSSPIVRNPEIVEGADCLFIESTYGAIFHESRDSGREKLKQIINEVNKNNGVLMMPVFALERSQEMIFEIKNFLVKGKISPIPVYLDSPLAIKITDIYREFFHLFDEDASSLMKKGEDVFDFRGLKYIRKPNQSRKISKTKGAKIVLAGSGMCEGGRIGDYLKRHLGNSKNKLVLVSFQVKGTLGNLLASGAQSIKIDKQNIRVKAEVISIRAFSSHADQGQVISWIGNIKKPKPKKVFIIHGEEESNIALEEKIKEMGLKCIIPVYDRIYEI
ncbi:MAG TPA: MBL fold metallo-hydrolase [Candidatus Pacearchaeota archaeon]|nr:MBL fold metallo-hydrolase [Candidatus Parcubacteria bacterium]HNP79247.1 MBL fold metallo-hydrolase [Candidatus Pacearchaeota archaeon]HOC53501.1 MBL fold metallo-hydrolase [Candidatus Pacearchaeota archaeon]HQM24424.1 MBL fold metallo-hydrolase [Candidatus Pacearchaeota archaeon]